MTTAMIAAAETEDMEEVAAAEEMEDMEVESASAEVVRFS